MSKRLISYFFFLALIVLNCPSSSRAMNIGVVDMGLIYRQYEEVSKSQAYIKEKKDEYQGIIDKEKYSLKEEELALESLKEDLRANRESYNDSELQRKENEQRRLVTAWQKKFQAMKSKFEKYKTELENIEKKEFESLRKDIDRAISSVARELSLGLVLEKQWVYYGKHRDITQRVLSKLER